MDVGPFFEAWLACAASLQDSRSTQNEAQKIIGIGGVRWSEGSKGRKDTNREAMQGRAYEIESESTTQRRPIAFFPSRLDEQDPGGNTTYEILKKHLNFSCNTNKILGTRLTKVTMQSIHTYTHIYIYASHPKTNTFGLMHCSVCLPSLLFSLSPYFSPYLRTLFTGHAHVMSAKHSNSSFPNGNDIFRTASTLFYGNDTLRSIPDGSDTYIRTYIHANIQTFS